MKLIERLIDTIWYFFCFSYCSNQCWHLWADFFEYPSYFSTQTGIQKEYSVPGVTVCSSIGVTRLTIEKFARTTSSNDSNQDNSVDSTILSDESDEESSSNYWYNKYITNTPMDQVLADSLQYDQLIVPEWMSCSADTYFGEACNNSKASCIHSFQAKYSCFTLFHYSVLSEAQVATLSMPIGIKGSPYLIGAYEVASDPLFQPIRYGEMMRFVINTSSSLSVFDNTSATARISVIENNRIRTSRTNAFIVRSNEFAIIYLQLKLFNLLPPPYESMCYDYEKNHGGKRKHPLFEVPRSRRDCAKACIAKLLIDNCKCWPPEIPFVSVDELPETDRLKYNVPLCDWVRRSREDSSSTSNRSTVSRRPANTSHLDSDIETEMTKKARSAFKKCYRDIEKKCAPLCPKNCQFKEYDENVQIFSWPYQKAINYSIFSNYLKNFTSCCSLISIRYSTPMFSKYFMESKFELVEIVTYMGGLVSLWLGFTVISAYSFLDDMTSKICRKSRDKRKNH